jgi:hypothetical protein
MLKVSVKPTCVPFGPSSLMLKVPVVSSAQMVDSMRSNSRLMSCWSASTTRSDTSMGVPAGL